MGIMGRIGFRVESLSGLGLGSMGRLGSMGMWTIAMIRGMGTTGRSRLVGRSRSTTSRVMRPMMGMGMWLLRRTTRLAMNMRCLGSMAAAGIPVVGIRGS
jgi:hypothetical protein